MVSNSILSEVFIYFFSLIIYTYIGYTFCYSVTIKQIIITSLSVLPAGLVIKRPSGVSLH